MQRPSVDARMSDKSPTIIVDNCPYCEGSHSHNGTPENDGEARLADCMIGEYHLRIRKASETKK